MRFVPRSDLATCGILGIFQKAVLHLASWRAAVNSALQKKQARVIRPSAASTAPRKDTILTHSDRPADQKTPLEARISGPLTGKARVPGDKSISHRSLILGRWRSGKPGYRAFWRAKMS